MWNLLKKSENECATVQGFLENAATAQPKAASVEELIAGLPAAQQTHFAACEKCQDSAQDILAVRKIFEGISSQPEETRPWFATRVMAAIAERERELSEVASTWLAVPKFASRLALASGALLLVASTWLYERPLRTPNEQATTLAAQESLFEAPPPMNQDDVLVNVQENNP